MRKILPFVLVSLLSACGVGSGSQNELEETLELSGEVTAGQSECISDGIFAQYGQNEGSLSQLSGSEYDEIINGDPEIGVPGFEVFYEQLLSECLG